MRKNIKNVTKTMFKVQQNKKTSFNMKQVIISLALCLLCVQVNAQNKRSEEYREKLINDFMVNGNIDAYSTYSWKYNGDDNLLYALFMIHHYPDKLRGWGEPYHTVYDCLMHLYIDRNIPIDSTMYELALSYLEKGVSNGSWPCAINLSYYYFWGCLPNTQNLTTIRVERDTIKAKYYYKLAVEKLQGTKDTANVNPSLKSSTDSIINRMWYLTYGKYLKDSVTYENEKKKKCGCNPTSNR